MPSLHPPGGYIPSRHTCVLSFLKQIKPHTRTESPVAFYLEVETLISKRDYPETNLSISVSNPEAHRYQVQVSALLLALTW